MEWVLVKTLLSLAAVLGLMVGVVFLLKKFVYGVGKPSSAAVDIRVLGSRSLSPKKSISVVGVMGRVLVVGLSEQGMTLLTECAIEDLPEEAPASPDSSRASGKPVAIGSPFLAHLGRSLTKLLAKEKETLAEVDQKEGTVTLKSASTAKNGNEPASKSVQRGRKGKTEYA